MTFAAPLLLGEARLRDCLPMAKAIQAIEECLACGLDPEREIERTITQLPAGQLLFMPAAGPTYAGAKLVGVAPGNAALGLARIHGVYVLLDGRSLAPIALLDGAALTALRTPAVSAVAVDRLAVPQAETVVVFGTGPQARGHLEAVRSVRSIRQVGIVGRSVPRVEKLVEECRREDLEASAVSPDAVRTADIVVCATSAKEPLFSGRAVPEHSLVVAVGSHEPNASEVDPDLVERATVVVESRSAALREAGDILMAIRAGRVSDDCIVGSLADLVRGRVVVDPGRPRLFKSVGMAWEDLAVAAAAFDAWRARGLR